MAGVFSLFALATGILRVAGKDGAHPMLQAVVDEAVDGLLITDPRGRVIYANAAYLDLVDARDADDVRPIERVFIGDPDVSEAVYRLLKAAREGRRAQEEVRVTGLRGKPVNWLRLRVRPLGDGKRMRPADALGRHRRHPRPRAAGEHLPGAAARHRLPRPRAGRLLLGRWQGRHPLHQRHARRLARSRSRPGRLRRADAVRHRLGQRRGASHHARRRSRRGEDRGDGPRLQDPRRAARCRCACSTRSRSAPTARRARRARWCSTARRAAPPIRRARPKCASCASSSRRRWRSPRSTRPERSRAPIRCLPACSRQRSRTPRAARSSSVVSERDREALEAAIKSAAAGQSEIAPVEAALSRHRRALGPLLRLSGRGGRPRDRGRDRLRARHHRPARHREPARPGREDEIGRPAGRRHRPRLQQRALRHHDGDRLPAERAQADRSVVPGHHADQAERQPGREPGAATAGVLAPPDACGRR